MFICIFINQKAGAYSVGIGIVEHIAEHVASAREQDVWALTAATALHLLLLLIYEG